MNKQSSSIFRTKILESKVTDHKYTHYRILISEVMGKNGMLQLLPFMLLKSVYDDSIQTLLRDTSKSSKSFDECKEVDQVLPGDFNSTVGNMPVR